MESNKDKIIIIRYSEIHLKGNNRGFFENALVTNIKRALEGFTFSLQKTSGRYLLSKYDHNREDEIAERVRCVFGVYSYSIGYAVKTDIDAIDEIANLLMEDISGTFRVNANRADKKFGLNSMQIAAEIGGRILSRNAKLSVNLHNPEHILYVDVRETGNTLVYSNVIRAVNGMPVGTSGKGVLLLSGGIDSPVACYLIAKRGMSIRALHFHSYPYTSQNARLKVLELAKILKRYTINLTVDIISVTEIQTEIHEKCNEDYMITLLRRFMMKIANIIADKEDCKAIITGESLGQVASQTIESITCTNEIAQVPVLRPLIAYDKDEIIEVAKRIKTFDTSILPYEDCCTVFLPKSPATKPKLWVVEREEQKLDCKGLIERALATLETVTI
ncbi:MAG: tRNA 4-thiouridine(8) synthase ThiI [Clostridia bacterium]|nr:tRNA 4-thiouridine(8) synthase ThiI [Clostridia bacterium]